jgi:hypothetical protein
MHQQSYAMPPFYTVITSACVYYRRRVDGEGAEMVVNHYVVSWIQVIGLVVGLLGFFYASVGLFGKAGSRFLRPLLPALALAILGAVGPLLVSIPGQGRDPVTVLLTTLVYFAAGYFMAYFSQKPRPFVAFGNQALQANARREVVRLASFGIVVIAVVVVVVLVEWQAPTSDLSFAGFVAMFAVLIWATVELPMRLNERAIIAIGVVTTVLAVLTQFIPPVLDLLNIPIR